MQKNKIIYGTVHFMTSKYKIKLIQITEIQHCTDNNTSNYDSTLN